MDTRGPPHDGLFLVLAYLPLHQLLLMSQVSKSFRDEINSDVLIWLDLIVEKPLNLRLTDQILSRIALNARGRLRTLTLLNCFRISDDGLMRVIRTNPLLTKLYVPGCTGLTPEILLKSTKMLPKLKHIKINGIYNLKQEHLQELLIYLPETIATNTRFYHKYQSSTFQSLDEDDATIDVGLCPKCKEVRLVFGCPRESCRSSNQVAGECLGCNSCIPRCESCGICVSKEDDEEIEETLCNDTLCRQCWVRLPKCNHCNKSFCPRHADGMIVHSDVKGFVCEACELKEAEYI